jgi:hypothetical protein
MVGAMHLRVTVETGSSQQLLRRADRRDVIATVQSARMVGILMTTLAQERCAQRQQAIYYRTMRIMAIGTAIADRLVLPQKRTALFRVATRARVIDSVAEQQMFSHRAMRVMAIAARHESFVERVMRSQLQLRALFLMTADTHGYLRGFAQYRVIRLVDVVAGDTGKTGELMLAAAPVCSQSILMATQTHLILHVG